MHVLVQYVVFQSSLWLPFFSLGMLLDNGEARCGRYGPGHRCTAAAAAAATGLVNRECGQ